MKSFLGGLGNLILFLGEVAVCVLLVLYLGLNPIAKESAETEESERTSLVKSEQSGARGLDGAEKPDIIGSDKGGKTSQSVAFVQAVPMLEWNSGFYAPAKRWGYEGEYSPTTYQWIPGTWKTANMSSQAESGIGPYQVTRDVPLIVCVPY